MPKITTYTATFEGEVQAYFVCDACDHRAGVVTQVAGTGSAATMYLFHDLAQDASNARAEKRARELAQLFTKALTCPACAHRPPSPAVSILKAEWWGILGIGGGLLFLAPVFFVLASLALFGLKYLMNLRGVADELILGAAGVVTLVAVGFALYEMTAELRGLYERMSDPARAGFRFTEPGPPPKVEPSLWEFWRGAAPPD